jgi:hypothetical protein
VFNHAIRRLLAIVAILGSAAAGTLGAALAYAAPSPVKPISVVRVWRHAIPASQCDLLLKHGYSQDACVVTITATTIATQPQLARSSGRTPYVLGGGCGSTYSMENYMDASQGPVWGVEVHTWFDYSSCSVWPTNVACYQLYSTPGTVVTKTNCTRGTTGNDGYGFGTFNIATFGLNVTERMEVTDGPSDPLRPTYSCSPQSCTQ